jgi:hypothetical protein
MAVQILRELAAGLVLNPSGVTRLKLPLVQLCCATIVVVTELMATVPLPRGLKFRSPCHKLTQEAPFTLGLVDPTSEAPATSLRCLRMARVGGAGFCCG